MIRVTLGIVPAGGGETEYNLPMELPAVPQEGDYISVTRKGEDITGTEDFIVKRTWWGLEFDDSKSVGGVREIYVECYPAVAGWSTEDHKRLAEPGGLKFDDSMY